MAEADPELRIKTALCETRTDDTAGVVVDAIVADAPMWIAVARTEEGGPVGVAESRSAAGERFLEVFRMSGSIPRLSRTLPQPNLC